MIKKLYTDGSDWGDEHLSVWIVNWLNWSLSESEGFQFSAVCSRLSPIADSRLAPAGSDSFHSHYITRQLFVFVLCCVEAFIMLLFMWGENKVSKVMFVIFRIATILHSCIIY